MVPSEQDYSPSLEYLGRHVSYLPSTWPGFSQVHLLQLEKKVRDRINMLVSETLSIVPSEATPGTSQACVNAVAPDACVTTKKGYIAKIANMKIKK